MFIYTGDKKDSMNASSFRYLLPFVIFLGISQILSTKSYSAVATDDAPGGGTLSGKVTEKEKGSPLAGASVYIPDLKVGAVTDKDGFYKFNNLPSGTYLVEVRYIGYGTFSQTVDFTKTSVLDARLSLSTIESEEVVVTGVSKATQIKRAPIPIVAVGKSYIDQHSATGNVIDEIANLPGISAVTTGPNISKPFIHGLGYNRVVTAEDGIRQEGQQWGDEHGIEVDQNSIDRIEIIKGPASLSYGSDAIGGVVNLMLKHPYLFPRAKYRAMSAASMGPTTG